VWKGVQFLTNWGLLEGDGSAAPRCHDKDPTGRGCFVLLGALETITSLVIIRWYCDMIVFFECSYLSTFGNVRVANDVRKLNQRSHQR
jgi:hypothetical protein